MPVDQLKIKNAQYKNGSGTLSYNVSGTLAQGCNNSSEIPQIFEVNTSLVNPQKSLNDKFRFPSKDNPLTEAAKMEIPKIQSLEYIINIFAGRLDLDLKTEWDLLAGRDVSVPEISANGVQLTVYDIKQQCSNFRKNLEKEEYVQKISGVGTKTFPNKKSGGEVFTTQTHPVQIFAAKIKTPRKGLLFDFLLE